MASSLSCPSSLGLLLLLLLAKGERMGVAVVLAALLAMVLAVVLAALLAVVLAAGAAGGALRIHTASTRG